MGHPGLAQCIHTISQEVLQKKHLDSHYYSPGLVHAVDGKNLARLAARKHYGHFQTIESYCRITLCQCDNKRQDSHTTSDATAVRGIYGCSYKCASPPSPIRKGPRIGM